MDPAYVPIIVALIGAVATLVAIYLENWLKRNPPEHSRKNPKRRKLWAALRKPIVAIAVGAVVLLFLYHTRIIPSTAVTLTDDACPGRQPFPDIEALEAEEIRVRNGEVAYYMGWIFDSKDGGYFITFKGPYKGSHVFRNGVYCPPVPSGTLLAQSTEELLRKECQESKGGCIQEKTCAGNILTYHLTKGDCDE